MPLEFDPTDNDDYAMQQLISVIVRLWRGLPGITTSVGDRESLCGCGRSG